MYLCVQAPSGRRPPTGRPSRSGAGPGPTFPLRKVRAATRLASAAQCAGPRRWRGRAASLAAVGRRHANGETCAQHPSGGRPPVGGADRPAIGLHDLAANRQSQPRVLAEMLGRALRVEALEDRFQILLGNAGPLVVDGDDERSAARLAAELHDDARSRWAERKGIVDDVAEYLAVAAVVTMAEIGWIGGDAELDLDVGLLGHRIVLDHVAQQRVEVDGLDLAAHQLGIES